MVDSEGRGGVVDRKGRGGVVDSEGRGGVVDSEGRGGVVDREGRGGVVDREGRGGVVDSEGGLFVNGAEQWLDNDIKEVPHIMRWGRGGSAHIIWGGGGGGGGGGGDVLILSLITYMVCTHTHTLFYGFSGTPNLQTLSIEATKVSYLYFMGMGCLGDVWVLGGCVWVLGECYMTCRQSCDGYVHLSSLVG